MKPAVARIALSYEACELSELARRAVPTNRSTTEAVADAGRILQAAQRFLAVTVLAAEADGLDWPTIAHLLASTDPDRSTWRTTLLSNPHEAAEDLDDWVLRHAEEDPGPTPVSGALHTSK
ncbi:hypothetical protein EV138_2167 [Kribbella voronezhensis]|uniref:Uncharacterized protein n=1 Tax=Kribbella voronezhensis TaxID=2512212 RepID=A0A4R7T9J9_9ACTN|nr:hypothetical protein [Kribbella voronezhensis]TDU88621.1 hypothetical protein EV138_2167 [Kribbella voronezhensis]